MQAAPVTQQQEVMPYKTYYVTQACEWKSNLFVPKSNDIHFAQPQQQQQQQSNGDQMAKSAYEQQKVVLDDGPASRTIFSTTNKALILALPIAPNPGFAGYEPGKCRA